MIELKPIKMKKKMIKIFIFSLLISCMCLSVSGCGHPYSAKKSSIIDLFEQRKKNILNSNELSQQTQQYLRLKNLIQEYKEDRIELIKEIYNDVLQKKELQGVYVLTELCIQEGRKLARRNMEGATALYLTAAEAGYR